MMQYKKLAGTELTVSRVCLGTMTFGKQMEEHAAAEAVAYAVEQGVNFIDTADVYPPGQNTSETERILGRVLAPWREKLVLATKGGGRVWDGPDGQGLSRQHLTRAVEESLRRLRTDRVELYYAHFPDRDVTPEEFVETMNGLIRAGKIRYYGVSNFSAWQLCELVLTARAMGAAPPVVSQSVYNLLTRGIEGELLPCLEKFGLDLVVYNPLAGGMLTGKYRGGEKLPDTRFTLEEAYARRYWSDRNIQAVERIRALAEARGQSVLALSLQWLLARETVGAVILGFSRMEQLRENLAAVAQAPPAPLPEEELRAVWEDLTSSRFSYIR